MLVKKTVENIDEAAKELPHANYNLVLQSGDKIDLKHFRSVKPLGSGDTGSVHLVELLNTGEYFAMKAMDKSIMFNHNKGLAATGLISVITREDCGRRKSSHGCRARHLTTTHGFRNKLPTALAGFLPPFDN
uniref:non-specific serine/threonine protein kinase n=1 Tax=Leersia perrieri TaxID=77586 RepID=A0A0D9WE64_9ORYZ